MQVLTDPEYAHLQTSTERGLRTMRGPIGSRKCLVLMLVLLVFGTHGISYGQAPRVVASTESPLTESRLSQS